MIGKLKGYLSEVDGNIGLIETGSGVFYQVFLQPGMLARPLPSPVEIYTYLQVREDALILFGFQTKGELELYKLLLLVPGVGPKSAFSISSYAPIPDIIQAIKDNNVGFFTSIPGLGKKTAMKILLELATKLSGDFKLENMYVSEDEKIAVDALISLGFKSHDAKDIIAKLPKELSVEEKIKEGIKIGTSHNK